MCAEAYSLLASGRKQRLRIRLEGLTAASPVQRALEGGGIHVVRRMVNSSKLQRRRRGGGEFKNGPTKLLLTVLEANS